MISIKQVIVVEGKYDKIKLSQIFDTLIVTTNGFMVYKNKEKREFLMKLAKERGIIILTDSDSAGFRIRNHLKNILGDTDVRHAYIPEISGKEKRKVRPGAEGLLGVEGISDDIIISAVMKVAETKEAKTDLVTKSDLYELGLSGSKESGEKRKRLLKHLDLPSKMTSNALLDTINILFTKEEFIGVAKDFMD